MHSRVLGATLGFCYSIFTPPLVALEIDSSWIGGPGGFWSNSVNWDTLSAPDNTVTDIYNVFINDDASPGPTVVSLDIDATINSLSLGTNAAVGVNSGTVLVVNNDISGSAGSFISSGSGATVIGYGNMTDLSHSSTGGILANSGGSVSNITNSSGFLTLSNSTIGGTITNNDKLVVDGDFNVFDTTTIGGTGSILDGGLGAIYKAADNSRTLTFSGDQTIDGARFETVGGQVIVNGALRASNGGSAHFHSDVSGTGSIQTQTGGSSIFTHRTLEGLAHTGGGILSNDGGTVRNITNISGFLTLNNSTLDGRITNNDKLVLGGTSSSFDTALIDGTGSIVYSGVPTSFTAADSTSTLIFGGDQTIDGAFLGTINGQVIINGALRTSNGGTADIISNVSGTGSIHTSTGSPIVTRRVLEGVTHLGTGILFNDGGTVRNITNNSGFLTLNNSTLDGRITNNDQLVVGGSSGAFDTALIDGTGSIVYSGTSASFDAVGVTSTLTFGGDQTIDGAFLGTTDGQVIINGALRTSNGGTADFFSDVSGTGSIHTSSGASVMTHRVLEGVTHLGTGILLNDGGTVRNIANNGGFLTLNNSTLDGRITNNDKLVMGGSSGAFDTVLIDGTGSIVYSGTPASFDAVGVTSTLTFGGNQTIDGAVLGTTDGQVIINGALRASNGGLAEFFSDVSGTGSIHTSSGASIFTYRVLEGVAHLGTGILLNDGGTVRNITNISGFLTLNNSTLDGWITNNDQLVVGGSTGSFTTALIDGTGSITDGGTPAAYTAAGATSTLTFGGDQTIDGAFLGTTNGQVIIDGTLRTSNGGSANFVSDVTGTGVIHTDAGTAIVTRRLLEDITHQATGTGVLANDGGIVRNVTNESGVLSLTNSQLQGHVINNAIIAAGGAINQVFVSTDATLTNNGVIQADVRIESNGVLKGTGLVEGNLTNDGGILAPGLSPGTSSIAGDYIQLSNGTFAVEIGGYQQGVEYDWLDVGGGALLDGILDVSLYDSGTGLFQPTLGDTFDILTADTIAGKFDLVTSVALGTGLKWDVSYIHEAFGTDIVRLSVSQVPVPGAVWLFGSGLVGLVGMARRRKTT